MKSHTIETLEEESHPVICSVWGLNDCGQLLNNEEQILRHPTVLPSAKGVFGFASGDFHTLVMSDTLKLYSAGLNIYGQLGIPSSTLKEQNTHVPQEIAVLPSSSLILC